MNIEQPSENLSAQQTIKALMAELDRAGRAGDGGPVIITQVTFIGLSALAKRIDALTERLDELS